MRIGVDGGCWANGRGYGRYVRELLGSMVELAPDDRFLVYLDPETRSAFELEAPNLETVVVDLDEAPGRAASSDGRRSVGDLLRLSREVARTEGLDVFFFPSVYTYFPLPPGTRSVVAIHDVIADRYPELTLPTWRARLFWKAKVALAIRQAGTILTVSDYSAREISRHLGVPPDRIRVAGEAPAPVFRPTESGSRIRETAARHGLPEGAEWFLYVGGFNPHKRVDALVRAHARLVRETDDPPPYLLLVGAVDDDVFHRYDEAVRREIRNAGTGRFVVWTGFVPDEELRHLYSGARAAVLPSREEGFGLPAVEAAACGTPVVATTASPLPDLLEGGGIFVDPADEESLYEALLRLAGDDDARRRLGATARRKARRLSWDDGGRAALDALRECAA